MKNLTRPVKSTRPIKVIQFGGGNFLRGYIDWMIDVLNIESDFNGDVLLIKPTENGSYDSLQDQDNLYHVFTKGIKESALINSSHLIECIQDVIQPYREWQQYIDSAKISSIRFIVSNTTESGIKFNATDLMEDKPPQEFPAKLTQWLWARYNHFEGNLDKGCLCIPCELIENNGAALKKCILQYSSHWNLENNFISWINEACHFSNTLVDRIVTGFPKDNIEDCYETIGYYDKLIVEAEPYHLLAIEGSALFQKELPFDQTNLNVVFTDDLNPYREIKVRILNGAHTSLVPVAYLEGIRTVKDAIENPDMNLFIQNILYKNIIPTLDFPQETLIAYANDVQDRFKNPYIKHQLIDISLNSISKFKTRLLPSLLHYIDKTGELPEYICEAFAALIIFYRGFYNGEQIGLRDNEATLDFFKSIWSTWDSDQDTLNLIETVLSKTDYWGQDLTTTNGLSSSISKHILRILSQQSVS